MLSLFRITQTCYISWDLLANLSTYYDFSRTLLKGRIHTLNFPSSSVYVHVCLSLSFEVRWFLLYSKIGDSLRNFFHQNSTLNSAELF